MAAPQGWSKLYDDWAHHGKFLALKNGWAFAIYFAGQSYCNRFLTDGLVPKTMLVALVPNCPCAKRAAQDLVTANLWHDVLKSALMSTPPPGHRAVTYAQLRAADLKVFSLVSEECSDGTPCKPGETTSEFEQAFKNNIYEIDVRMLLQPLPGSSTSSPPEGDSPRGPAGRRRRAAFGQDAQAREPPEEHRGAGACRAPPPRVRRRRKRQW